MRGGTATDETQGNSVLCFYTFIFPLCCAWSSATRNWLQLVSYW